MVNLHCKDMRVSVLVAQLCATLFDPIDWDPPSSSVHGILQARILEWVAIPFSRGSSQPRGRTWVSCIAGRHFILWATREACTHSLPHPLLSPRWACQKHMVRKPSPPSPQLLSKDWVHVNRQNEGLGYREQAFRQVKRGSIQGAVHRKKALSPSPKEPHLGISMGTAFHVGGDSSRGSWLPWEK